MALALLQLVILCLRLATCQYYIVVSDLLPFVSNCRSILAFFGTYDFVFLSLVTKMDNPLKNLPLQYVGKGHSCRMVQKKDFMNFCHLRPSLTKLTVCDIHLYTKKPRYKKLHGATGEAATPSASPVSATVRTDHKLR